MKTNKNKRPKVGELRPSQAITTFGIGSIIDLPNLSVMVMGLDDWPVRDTVEIGEHRLLATVREVLGEQVLSLRSAPIAPDDCQANRLDASTPIGIPVAPFPRWMVCPHCRRLAPLSSGLFKLETSFRTDQIRYVHANCNKKGKSPTAVPARFIVACKNGHLDDFPWREFTHRGPTECKGGLKLLELTATGEASGIEVRCEGENCGASRRMSDAFKIDREALPFCQGRRPHLRDHDEGTCKASTGENMRMSPMLQGASNSWFGIIMSALAIPQGVSELSQLVNDHWTVLEKANREIIEFLQSTPQHRYLADYSSLEIWNEVEARKARIQSTNADLSDLKTPEWAVFTNPDSTPAGRDFQLCSVNPPAGYAHFFEKIVLVERIREVRALVGFTRIESPSDYDNPTAFPASQRVRLSRSDPTWVPASEIRGEGLFFHFKEELIQQWLAKEVVKSHDELFLEAHRRWRIARHLEPPDEFYPGLRFVLLHSFAHALIRQFSIECGYTTASLRERIYSRDPGEGEPEMAAVLIYTAAPDSEGTLGGLVSLGKPETLERHLDQALDNVRLCASDPLCAEHHPYRAGVTLHAASCHACLFAPETSCERGNKYLDRAVLVTTVESRDLAFFE